jgi:hypothetical protein
MRFGDGYRTDSEDAQAVWAAFESRGPADFWAGARLR